MAANGASTTPPSPNMSEQYDVRQLAGKFATMGMQLQFAGKRPVAEWASTFTEVETLLQTFLDEHTDLTKETRERIEEQLNTTKGLLAACESRLKESIGKDALQVVTSFVTEPPVHLMGVARALIGLEK